MLRINRSLEILFRRLQFAIFNFVLLAVRCLAPVDAVAQCRARVAQWKEACKVLDVELRRLSRSRRSWKPGISRASNRLFAWSRRMKVKSTFSQLGRCVLRRDVVIDGELDGEHEAAYENRSF